MVSAQQIEQLLKNFNTTLPASWLILQPAFLYTHSVLGGDGHLTTVTCLDEWQHLIAEGGDLSVV